VPMWRILHMTVTSLVAVVAPHTGKSLKMAKQPNDYVINSTIK